MPPETTEFLSGFIVDLLRDAHAFVPGNHDDERYPVPAAERRRRDLREKALQFASRFGWKRRNYNLERASIEIADILSHADGLAHTYAMFADDASRELMRALLRYRVLGPAHVALPLHTPEYWRQRTEEVAACRRATEVAKSGRWTLNEFEFAGARGPIRVALHDFAFATTFLIEHYALRRPGICIAAEPGDVVIDGGGCWGDTALYFADRVGERGRVVCFEFDADNLVLLDRNLSHNQHLTPQIELAKHALWEKSDETLRYSPCGPATSVGGGGEREVTTLSIDDLVDRRGLERVDFIKMDIEGAEAAALRGAERTIRRWLPKLAISAYHKPDDLAVLPAWIASLGLGYRIHLHHVTTHREETLVVADAR